MALTVLYLLESADFLGAAGYLPPPFFYSLNDTFMDWYNTAYWSNNPGAYDNWRSIYPPFSFAFLKFFSIGECYSGSEFIARDCDWLGRVTLFSFFFLNVILISWSYRKNDAKTFLPRAIAMSFGLPMLFALERGNLIVPCFTAFLLAHGNIVQSSRLRWLSLGATINLKPYLILTMLPNLLKRRWVALEGTVVCFALVYLLSFAYFGSGTPMEILSNILTFADKTTGNYVENTYYAGSYTSITGLLRSEFPMTQALGSQPVEFMLTLLPILVQLGQIGVVLTFLGAAIYPHLVPTRRLMALSVSVVLSSAEVGGYAQVFLLFLVFFERWRGAGRIVALLAAYLLCLPKDFSIVAIAHEVGDSYLTQRAVGHDIGVYVGEIVRPGLILLIEYGLTAVSLLDVVRRLGGQWLGRFRSSAGISEVVHPANPTSQEVTL